MADPQAGCFQHISEKTQSGFCMHRIVWVPVLSAGVALAQLSTASAAVVATPVLKPKAGTYNAAQSVTLSDATAAATIYYTTDGTTPTTSSAKYTGPIDVAKTETVKAIAAANGDKNSAVASAAYTILTPAATPVFSPEAGTYTVPPKVSISDATKGATIYYTTNGTAPTKASTKYTAPIKVGATETIEAIAIASGYTQSAVASAKYILQVATPVFSPASGTYTKAQSVKIKDSSAGATIYYTTNGTTPTTASTKYTTAIKVAETETIKAIGVATGHTESAVASAAYTLKVGTPVFSPAAGKYTKAQNVTITDLSSGATIYYTTNGATPTTASTKYTGAIKVGATETLKAIAVAPGETESAVASAIYTIETATVPSVVGETEAQASAAIKAADLIVGTVTKKSSATVPAGRVISENPVAGTHVTGGTAVNLVVSSGAGSLSGAYWVPFTEVSPGGSVVRFGVLPSNLAEDSFTAVATSGSIAELGQVFTYTLANGIVTGITPYAAVYAGIGAGGNIHLYSAELSNAGHSPAPTQFSSLSLPATDTVCDPAEYGYANLADPTSAYFIFEVVTAAEVSADPSACFDGLGTSYLVHLKDSLTTAPITLTEVLGGLDAAELFTSSGEIAGIAAFDTSHNLNFYPASGGLPSFAAPIRLAADVTDEGYDTVGLTRSGQLLPGGSQTFFSVSGSGSGGQYKVLRILANGNATTAFAIPYNESNGITFDSVYDTKNYYFTLAETSGTTQYLTIAVPFASGIGTTINSSAVQNTLIDSDGTHLIYTGEVGAGGQALLTLPVAGGSTFTQIAGGSSTQDVSAYLDFASGQIFVNLVSGTSVAGEVITAAGVVKSGAKAGTQYLPTALFDFGSGVGSTILQLEGVTNSSSMAGGSLYVTEVATLASTAVTLDGVPYVVPASIQLDGIQEGTTLIQGIGTNVKSDGDFGFLIDTSKKEIVTTPSTTTALDIFY
jgi:hypothetical protein